MQFIVISHQLKIIVFAVILGCISAFIYDIIALLKLLFGMDSKNEQTKTLNFAFLTNFIDLLYMIALTFSYCIFVYHFNSGHFRWYLVFSLFIGYLSYKVSIGKLFRCVAEFIVKCIRRLIALLIVKPLKLIFKGLIIIFSPLLVIIEYKRDFFFTLREKRKLIKEISV